MEDKLLEVGDWIYHKQHDKWYSRMKISRVTEKWAFVAVNDVAEIKFKRIYTANGWLYPSPSEKYPTSHYYIETPEIRIDFERAIHISKINQSLEKMKNENKSALTFEQAKIFREKITVLEEELNNFLALNTEGGQYGNGV